MLEFLALGNYTFITEPIQQQKNSNNQNLFYSFGRYLKETAPALNIPLMRQEVMYIEESHTLYMCKGNMNNLLENI